MRGTKTKRLLGSAVLALAIVAGMAQAASGSSGSGKSEVFSVKLTIKADAGKHRLSGAVLSAAPSEYCNEAKVRVREVMPGKDEVVAKVKPHPGGLWGLKAAKSLRGHRVYSETSGYQLPSRPVTCRAGRSHKVTAR